MSTTTWRNELTEEARKDLITKMYKKLLWNTVKVYLMSIIGIMNYHESRVKQIDQKFGAQLQSLN